MMNDKEYKEFLIKDILKRRAWCKRNEQTRETLEAKTTKILETIYDRAK